MYLDNAATTKPYDEVIMGMGKIAEWYYNPSAIYKEADEVRNVIEGCRKNIEWLLGGGHIYFTSGATESNNWVLRCMGGGLGSIVSDNIEHHSVLRVCEDLGAVIVGVESDGVVDVEKIVDAVTDETRLVSVMAVNNVLGTRNNIKEIVRRVKEKNENVLVHTDATQLVGHEWVNAMELGVDFLSASAHKFGGLKGTGLLWSREEISDVYGAVGVMLIGGGQEHGVRAGTENVVGIWAMSRALSISLRTCETDMQACKKMWERLKQGFEEIDGCVICGSTENRMFNNIYVAFKDISSEALVMALDDMGIMCSVGSACDSGELDKNYVLEAIGMDDEHIDGGLRLTYKGMFDDEEFFRCLKKCLRDFGYYND